MLYNESYNVLKCKIPEQILSTERKQASHYNILPRTDIASSLEVCSFKIVPWSRGAKRNESFHALKIWVSVKNLTVRYILIKWSCVKRANVYSKNCEYIACFITIACMTNNINKDVLLMTRCGWEHQSGQGPCAQGCEPGREKDLERRRSALTSDREPEGEMKWWLLVGAGGSTLTSDGNTPSVRENKTALWPKVINFSFFQYYFYKGAACSGFLFLCLSYFTSNLPNFPYKNVYGGYIFLGCF